MEETKSDLSKAMDRLQEEVEGVEAYKSLIEEVQDPALRKIFEQNLQAERQHVGLLHSYVNNEIQKMIQ